MDQSKSPFVAGGSGCVDGVLGKRDEGGCLPTEIEVSDEVFDDELGSEEDVAQVEADGFYALGYTLGLSKVGKNYDGSSVPKDRLDSTELDHEMIWEDSADLDDALDSFEEAANEALEKGDWDDDKRDTLARSLLLLRRGALLRRNNLKSKRGDIKDDKQITAEARARFLDRMSQKFYDKFGTTPEDRVSAQEGSSTPGLDLSPPLESSVEYDFDDYRPDDEVVSLGVMDSIKAFAKVMYDELGAWDELVTISNNLGEYIDLADLVPGSQGYRETLRRIGLKIKDRYQRKGLTKLQNSRLGAGLEKMWKAIERKEQAINRKLEAGIEVTQDEISDYEAMHDLHASGVEGAVTVDRESLTGDEPPDDLEFTPDPGFISPTPPKASFKPTPGSPRGYFSGIKSFPGSARNSRWGRLNSSRGTRPGTRTP
jgi:hypothetical protein